MVVDTTHPSEDNIELYSLGRLAEPELSTVEEHLLICEVCQERVLQEDRFRRALYGAVQELRRRNPNWPDKAK